MECIVNQSGLDEAKHRLMARLRPPMFPVGAAGDWKAVETQLGVQLPADYKWYIETYGLGYVCDLLMVISPFPSGRNLSDFNSWAALNMQRCADTGYLQPHSYSYYPSQGGLLAFAKTLDYNWLFWETAGAADVWRIVVLCQAPQRLIKSEYNSIVELLLALLELRVAIEPGSPISEGSFEEPQDFIPYDQSKHGEIVPKAEE